MVIDFADLITQVPDEKLFQLIEYIKDELKIRFVAESVYEPTSNPDMDNAHYEHVRKLEEMVKKLE